MGRLIYSNDSFFWFFDENNWSIISSKLSIKYFLKLNFNIELSDFFFFFNDNFFNYNNINLSILNLNNNELNYINYGSELNLVNIIYHQVSFFILNNYYINLNSVNIFNTNYNILLYFHFSYFLNIIFLILFFFIIILKFFIYYNNTEESKKSIFTMYYEEFLILWINMIGIKFESYEEAICIIIIWPWCIFLVFTHIFSLDNNEVYFIFTEWGLPIIFGYLIILENLWIFGVHFFTYINGARGRRFLLMTLLEDIITFAILISRVSLQMVRGLICNLYHDFFREISEYLLDSWETYWFYLDYNIPFCKNNYILDFTLFFIDWYIIVFVLLFIYFILFLQLLFLVIAVWLFCRCWFISIKITNNIFLSYNNNTIRDSNLKNKNSHLH